MRFGAWPDKYADVRSATVALLPVPYDGTSTWGKGADRGPKALLAASQVLEWYDIETGTEVYRRGIATAPAVTERATPSRMVAAVQRRVQALLGREKFVVVLGGEHSVTVGAVAAHAERYADLSVLQLDAHSDLRQEFKGSQFNHGCVMARVKERCPIVQVGIRSMDSSEKAGMTEGAVFFAERILDRPAEQWLPKVIERLSRNVYLTIDLDVFDPAVMPSTGTPEPGGLGWYAVLNVIRQVAATRRIVGFDVVELCPNPNDRAPDFLAAKLVYKTLSYIFEGSVKP
jgi:agmatinase